MARVRIPDYTGWRLDKAIEDARSRGLRLDYPPLSREPSAYRIGAHAVGSTPGWRDGGDLVGVVIFPVEHRRDTPGESSGPAEPHVSD